MRISVIGVAIFSRFAGATTSGHAPRSFLAAKLSAVGEVVAVIRICAAAACAGLFLRKPMIKRSRAPLAILRVDTPT